LVVTGAGRGIGAATVRAAARDGWDVMINYRQDRRAAEALADAVRAMGRKALTCEADIASEDGIARLFAAVDDAGRAPAAVVCNAGTLGTACRLEDLDAAMFRRVLDVNLFGAALVAREAVRRMSTR